MSRIVRTELKYQRESDKYPTEIAWTDAGTWVIPEFHLGRWTGRIVASGESLEDQQQTGGRITRDDLGAEIIAAAQSLGWPPPKDLGLLMYKVEASGGKLMPSDSLRLASYAHRAIEWMNANRAPDGRRFVLEDALYLIRVSDTGRGTRGPV